MIKIQSHGRARAYKIVEQWGWHGGSAGFVAEIQNQHIDSSQLLIQSSVVIISNRIF